MPLKKIKEKKDKSKKDTFIDGSKVAESKLRNTDANEGFKKKKPKKMGNPAVVTEYEDARENQMINRDIPTMKTGGICKGGGAAIKGTDFKGVF